MTTSGCHFETLAVEGCVAVQRCVECGGIVLDVGCTSLRLDQNALEVVARVIFDAREAIAERTHALDRLGARGSA